MFLDYRLPEPKFEVIPGGFAVTVYATVKSEVTDILEHDPLNDPLNDRQKKVIELIQNDRFMTQELMAENIKISIETIKRDIQKFQKLNLIQRKGSKKTGYWQVIKNN
ncbi:MAG: DeoR family transcriptional regulator [Paludibacter sp.]|nr:DeoR family transcriptional regulator [Paludibacter sp.]